MTMGPADDDSGRVWCSVRTVVTLSLAGLAPPQRRRRRRRRIAVAEQTVRATARAARRRFLSLAAPYPRMTSQCKNDDDDTKEVDVLSNSRALHQPEDKTAQDDSTTVSSRSPPLLPVVPNVKSPMGPMSCWSWTPVAVGRPNATAAINDDDEPNQNNKMHDNFVVVDDVLRVSNPRAPFPRAAVRVLPRWLGHRRPSCVATLLLEQQQQQSTSHSSEAALRGGTWEGFDGPRRRIQTYHFLNDNNNTITNNSTPTDDTATSSSSSSSMLVVPPPILWDLRQRLWETAGLRASRVTVEDSTPVFHRRALGSYDPKLGSAFATAAAVRRRQRHSNAANLTIAKDESNNSISEAQYVCGSCHKPKERQCVVLESTAPSHMGNENAAAKQQYCTCFVVEIPLSIVRASEISPDDGHNDNKNINTSDETPFVLVQNWNQPQKRNAMCWNLMSPDHATDVCLSLGTALVKTSDFVHDWRSSRILYTIADNASSAANAETAPQIRVLQFTNIPEPSKNDNTVDYDDDENNVEEDEGEDAFGYVPTRADEMDRAQRRTASAPPPLSDLLTIIVTTSPIKSNPSTEVLERAMSTFSFCGPEFAFQCRKIIVCDGFRTLDDDDKDETNALGDDDNSNDNDKSSTATQPLVPNGATQHTNKISRRHNNPKQAMRNGIVNRQQAENFCQFKENLRQLCANAALPMEDIPNMSSKPLSVFTNTEMIELDERHGYGFALRHVLLHGNIKTPFVCVVQHDRTFMRPTPMTETVRAMWHYAPVKYVGFSMRSNLMYKDIFLGKYGSGSQHQRQQEWNDMVLYLSELNLEAADYGPDSASSRAMDVSTEKLRQNVRTLAETYQGSAQALVAKRGAMPMNGVTDDDMNSNDEQAHRNCQLSLVPTLYWYDNVHVCDTKHYRDFVFNKSYKMCARGGFVEDKLSPVLKRTVERMGLREGHSRFGCYLLDDHSGYFFTGHLDGGSYMSAEERTQLMASRHTDSAPSGTDDSS